MLPPPQKKQFHVWNLAEPAKSWPGAVLDPLLQMRLFFSLFFLLAHSGWCCGVWFLKTLGSRLCLFAHCLPSTPSPRPAPVTPPSPLRQMNGGFNEHGRGVDWAVLKML